MAAARSIKATAQKIAAPLTLLFALGLTIYMAGDAVKVWHRHRSKIANSPFRTIALKGAPQRFLGDLDSENGTPSNVWREFMPADSILGWRMGFNVAVSQYGQSLYVTNKQGFLSIGETDFFYPEQKQSGVLRIMILGGSTVMGCGAPTPASNLPAMIRKSLLALQQPTISKEHLEVINAGVGGYASTQEFLYLASELVAYKPDVVIIYDGWNDQVVNNHILNKREKNKPFSLFKTPTHWMLDSRANASFTLSGARNIFLVSLVNDANLFISDLVIVKRLRRFANWLRKNVGPSVPNKPGAEYIYDSASVTLYRDNLERMILLSKQRGFKLALFLQPIMGADTKPLSEAEKKIFNNLQDISTSRPFYRDARAVFKRLKQENSSKHLCINDLSHVFAAETSTVYADPGHLNPLGNRIVGEALVQRLKSCGFLHR